LINTIAIQRQMLSAIINWMRKKGSYHGSKEIGGSHCSSNHSNGFYLH
jgi:hypothetical protein